MRQFLDLGERISRPFAKTGSIPPTADVENIFHTAQSPAILGDEARHGIQKGIPPSKPIGLEEAREVTAKIIRRWLAEKSAAKGWAASSGALRGKAEA